MNISYTFKTEKDINNDEVLKEAKLGLPEIIRKAKGNKNVIKWLNGEEITDVEIRIVNAEIFGYEYRVYYILNNKALGHVKYCSGNSLDYYKVSFMKNFKR